MEIKTAERLPDVDTEAPVEMQTDVETPQDLNQIDASRETEKNETSEKPIKTDFCQDVGRIACAGCPFLKLCMPESDDNFIPFEEPAQEEVVVTEIESFIKELEDFDFADKKIPTVEVVRVPKIEKETKVEIISIKQEVTKPETESPLPNKSDVVENKDTESYSYSMTLENFAQVETVITKEEVGVTKEKVEVVYDTKEESGSKTEYETKKYIPDVVVAKEKSVVETEKESKIESITIKPKEARQKTEIEVKIIEPEVNQPQHTVRQPQLNSIRFQPKYKKTKPKTKPKVNIIHTKETPVATNKPSQPRNFAAKIEQFVSQLKTNKPTPAQESSVLKRGAPTIESKERPVDSAPVLAEKREEEQVSSQEITPAGSLVVPETKNIIHPEEVIMQSEEPSSEIPHQPTYLELLLDDEVEVVTTKGYYKNVEPPTSDPLIVEPTTSDPLISAEKDIDDEYMHKDIKSLKFNDNFVNFSDGTTWIQKILGTISIALYNNIYGSS